ncbi:MAG: NTP transferase domain-containing protein [Gammaproteobacteria bacterium]
MSRDECARLAEEMARDVLRALTSAPEISGIAILSREPHIHALIDAGTAGYSGSTRLYTELPDEDFRDGLGRAAADLASHGVRHLLVLPTDLPTISSADIAALLDSHTSGVTVCRAATDGGSNALVLSPPTVIPLLYGPASADRHLEAARQAGAVATECRLPAFARDVDTPDDMRWLLSQRIACATLAWLKSSGISQRLGKM